MRSLLAVQPENLTKSPHISQQERRQAGENISRRFVTLCSGPITYTGENASMDSSQEGEAQRLIESAYIGRFIVVLYHYDNLTSRTKKVYQTEDHRTVVPIVEAYLDSVLPEEERL